MRCKKYRDNIYEYLDGTLSPQDGAEFAEHTQTCSQCAAPLETEKQLAGAIKTAMNRQVSLLQAEGVQIPVTDKTKKRGFMPAFLSNPYLRPLVPVIPVLLVVVLVVVFTLNREIETPKPVPAPHQTARTGVEEPQQKEEDCMCCNTEMIGDPYCDWQARRLSFNVVDPQTGALKRVVTSPTGIKVFEIARPKARSVRIAMKITQHPPGRSYP